MANQTLRSWVSNSNKMPSSLHSAAQLSSTWDTTERKISSPILRATNMNRSALFALSSAWFLGTWRMLLRYAGKDVEVEVSSVWVLFLTQSLVHTQVWLQRVITVYWCRKQLKILWPICKRASTQCQKWPCARKTKFQLWKVWAIWKLSKTLFTTKKSLKSIPSSKKWQRKYWKKDRLSSMSGCIKFPMRYKVLLWLSVRDFALKMLFLIWLNFNTQVLKKHLLQQSVFIVLVMSELMLPGTWSTKSSDRKLLLNLMTFSTLLSRMLSHTWMNLLKPLESLTFLSSIHLSFVTMKHSTLKMITKILKQLELCSTGNKLVPNFDLLMIINSKDNSHLTDQLFNNKISIIRANI